MDNNKDELIFGETLNVDIFGDKIEEYEDVVTEDPKGTETKPKEEKKETKVDNKVESLDVDLSSLLNNTDSEDSSENNTDSNIGVDFNSVAQMFIETGEWEDFKLEDGTSFKDLVSKGEIDEKTFSEIKKQQDEWRVEKFKNESLDKLSDTEKEYLEFIKNGGDFNKFIQTYSIKQKVEDVDISTDNGQKSAVYSYYKNMLGWNDEQIQKHINRLVTDLELEDHAKFAKGKLQEVVDQQHAKLVKDQEEANLRRIEAENNYKEDIKSKLKEKQVNVKVTNQIVKDFTERDERGLTEIDRKFLEFRNNPEQIKFLWDILMNTDEFLKTSTQSVVNDEKLKTFKMIKFNTKPKKSNESLDTGGFIDIGLK